MQKTEYIFSQKTVNCYFDADFMSIDILAAGSPIVFITDENVYKLHNNKFQHYPTIKIPAGEAYKTQTTVDFIIDEFSLKNVLRHDLILNIENCILIIKNTFDKLSDEEMLHNFPLEKHGETVSNTHMLLHLYGHLNYHLGQINYHRRMIS